MESRNEPFSCIDNRVRRLQSIHVASNLVLKTSDGQINTDQASLLQDTEETRYKDHVGARQFDS